MKKITFKIRKIIKTDLKKYIFVLFFLLAGIIWGAISGVRNSNISSNENIMNKFISMYRINGIISDNLFFNALLSNIRLLVLLWVSGLSVYLIPLNPCCNLLKGFGIGYTISYLVCDSGFIGLFFSFISLFFQNIIIIPAMLFYSVYQINYVIHSRTVLAYKQQKKLRVKHSIVCITGIVICILSAIVETGVVTTIIKLIYGKIA